jgi:ribosomal protein S18 acetylase RimI-like enzyme
MKYELRAPGTAAEWDAYHFIRRSELFDRRGRGDQYNQRHPDEAASGNYPLLLFRDAVPIGAIRVDTGQPLVLFRMVSVRRDAQGSGAGRAMLHLAEAFARRAGGERVGLYSAPDAVGFYERCGYHRMPNVEPIGDSIPMGKSIAAESRRLLQHFLAALAYRTQKALRGAPANYFDFRAAATARTPHELVWHMTAVIGYARTMLHGGTFSPPAVDSFEAEVERFHATLAALHADFADRSLMARISDEQFLQGPLSDAMTHAGQLAMLRRLADSPVPSEDFIFARVQTDNVSAVQAEPAAPDAWWTPELGPRPLGH